MIYNCVGKTHQRRVKINFPLGLTKYAPKNILSQYTDFQYFHTLMKNASVHINPMYFIHVGDFWL